MFHYHTTNKELYKKHYEDAGYDLSSASDKPIKLYPGFSASIPTGIHIYLKPGQVGIIKARSGLSREYNIEVGAGVIDASYTGEIVVKLYRFLGQHSLKPLVIQKGDRIAQLIVTTCDLDAALVTEQGYNLLTEMSKRKDQGFGSTGK